MLEQLALALVIVATSVVSAWIALMLLSLRFGRGSSAALATAAPPALEQAVFLFDDVELVDATQPARALLEAAPLGESDWARLSAFLAPRFDGFAAALAQLDTCGKVELAGHGREAGKAPLRLLAETVGGLARLTLIDPEAEGRGLLVDSLSHRAMEDELTAMRAASDALPALSWRENADGAVVWANRAYVLRSNAIAAGDETLVWPLPRLFDSAPQPATGNTGARRLCLDAAGPSPAWYDLHTFAQPVGTLHFAFPADATVRAERTLREFVQTLTKTFADLPIGLAIFNRQRQLQLFNPALIDLTQLGGGFLSGRPTLYAFLDRLREARMMPEPKDYRSWRQQMTALEQASAAGQHSETWQLPGGQTYRVTGRPHPDGAVAFLFEDITSEISLTRRFRAELELGQEVLDAMDEAVAVFLPSGDLVTANAAYAQLWGVEPGSSLERFTVSDAIALWQARCGASPVWAELREAAARLSGRSGWRAEIELAGGQRLACRLAPLSAGATLVGFRPLPAPRAPQAARARAGSGTLQSAARPPRLPQPSAAETAQA